MSNDSARSRYAAKQLGRVAMTLVAFVIMCGGVAIATPKLDFKPGEALRAKDLNDSFKDVDSRLQAQRVMTVGTVSYSVGATKYCGKTNPTDGKITSAATSGYVLAKSLCQNVTAGCNTSPSAHMCSSEELVRSSQLGVAVDAGWYSTGSTSAISNAAGKSASDCLGWSSSDEANAGAVWNPSPLQPTAALCNARFPVLCCD